MGAVGTCIGVVFLLAIIGAIPIAMICLGAVRWNECPMEPWVPKFMVIAGAAGLLTILLSMCTYGFNQKENSGIVTILGILIGLVTLFSFAWNIAGSVWIFKKWSNWDNVKNDPTKGCYNDLYLFAFAYLIIFWITCPCQMGGGFKARQNNQQTA